MGKKGSKIGMKIGKLTVLSKDEKMSKEKNKYYYLCVCDCGNFKSIFTCDLSIKKINMCNDCSKKIRVSKNTKHGLRHLKIYKTYRSMIDRCYNPNNIKNVKNYQNYNITVCEEWKKSFINFYNWAIENGYKEGLSLERKNVFGNYEPSNCEFITLREQYFNKKNSFILKEENITLSKKLYLLNRSKEYGFIYARIKMGWSIEDALNKPKKILRRKKVED